MSNTTLHQRRFSDLDFLRILAAFLVIVNHTNSLVFTKLSPDNATWWPSVVWYYISKIAVPLFVMVSGACLLPRQDRYRRSLARFMRMLGVLVLFSYLYYLVNLSQTEWSWTAALNLPAFLGKIWSKRITDSYWYLYFYLGLLVMLPLLQKLASVMKKRDLEYLMAVSFSVFAVWPLVTHYAPALALPQYVDITLFGVFIGLFFAGHYLRAYVGRVNRMLCALVLLASLAVSTWLTYLEAGRSAVGVKYWFMDERTQPSVFVILSAIAVMLWAKQSFAQRKPLSEAATRRWVTLGSCAFGMYLLQDLAIAQTRYRLFVPLSQQINPLAAVLVWELGIFAVTLTATWVLKQIPLIKKLI